MPLMLDPFITENAFEMGSLTAAINILPNNYGRLREMNLFPPDYVPTRTVFIEEQNGVLSLLKTQYLKWNAPLPLSSTSIFPTT